MTEKEKMLQGLLYNASDPELTAERIRVKKLLYQLNVSGYDPEKGDTYKNILRELLPHSAPDLFIEPPFYCDYGYNIECGNGVYMNHNVIILDGTKVT
ncbi:MAG: sugar O-acetyltransferase, partial [Chlorobi bacterium]|nr:sugar O-acetyltransferase [Chlorobiota bacterium]